MGAVIESTKPHGKAILGINIQNHKGKAKAYQVIQVLLAVERLEVYDGLEK